MSFLPMRFAATTERHLLRSLHTPFASSNFIRQIKHASCEYNRKCIVNIHIKIRKAGAIANESQIVYNSNGSHFVAQNMRHEYAMNVTMQHKDPSVASATLI